MGVVGPGAQRLTTEDVKPLLDGASEYEYVTILNPLTDDFAVRVAQDLPVNMPFSIGKDTSGKVSQLTNSETDARQVYGLNLKNPDFQGRKHLVNDTIIRAGQTINLRGNEAQVAVRQLTHEILQREGKSRLLADPNLRKEVEERIVLHRGPIQELMDGGIRTARSQIDEAITKSNEVLDEKPFPGIDNGAAFQATATGDDSGGDATASQRRVGGRPRKNPQTADQI